MGSRKSQNRRHFNIDFPKSPSTSTRLNHAFADIEIFPFPFHQAAPGRCDGLIKIHVEPPGPGRPAGIGYTRPSQNDETRYSTPTLRPSARAGSKLDLQSVMTFNESYSPSTLNFLPHYFLVTLERQVISSTMQSRAAQFLLLPVCVVVPRDGIPFLAHVPDADVESRDTRLEGGLWYDDTDFECMT